MRNQIMNKFDDKTIANIPGTLLATGGIVTKDYNWFIPDQYNRNLDEDALLELQEDLNQDISEDEYPFQAPIVVYWKPDMDHGIISQGHHRFEVVKRLNRELVYVLTNTFRPSSRGQETEHQSWTTEELVKSYAREEIDAYVILNALKEKHPRYSYAALSVFLNDTATSKDKLRERKFQLNSGASLNRAEERIAKYEEFKQAAVRDDNSKEVIRVIVQAIDNPSFDWDYFIERTKANASEAKIRLEFNSISTNARATSLVQFYYNHKSKKNFYF